MCGIAGVFSRDPLDSVALGERLSRAMAHRGPDATGCHVAANERLLVVHRRLAIIDPIAGGQPMASADGRYVIALNGEIYNFRELAETLAREGEQFRTHSDTEVLLRLLERRGPAALASARGMFALALWDAREQTLLVARDRFGIKPLYVAQTSRSVAFASEIRALLAADLVPRRIDPAGVIAYLRWGSIPGPLTWLQGVEALAPGTWKQWAIDGRVTCGRFADARQIWVDDRQPVAEEALRRRVAGAFAASVRAHLVADVPVGVFLSGGIDSGAIVSAARSQGQRLRTFTVVGDDPAQSEVEHAALVAQRFDAPHDVLNVDASSVDRDWTAIRAALDQPTLDGVNSFYVSRAVAATGIKTVLSGLGGDEMFGGYPSFRRLPRALSLARRARPVAALAGHAVSLTQPEWKAAKWRHFAGSRGDAGEMYRALRGFLMPSELADLGGPALMGDRDANARVDVVEREILTPAAGERDVAAVARMETLMYMRSQLLRDADVMSMAHGLEIRVPFVDHVLAEAVWPAVAQHPALLTGKRLLLESLAAPLPDEVAHAPKRGFTLPFERWIDGPLAELVRSGLADLAADGWLASSASSRLWQAWQRRDVHWSRVWGLGVLGRFLRDE